MTNIQQRTFHDQVENAALEANHHVEGSDNFAVKGLPSLRGALGGSISFEKAQYAVAAEKRLVLSSEEVTDLDVRSAERERLRALGILSRKLHLSGNPSRDTIVFAAMREFSLHVVRVVSRGEGQR